MKDYKEVWQAMYEDGIELGMSEDEAGEYATAQTQDYYAVMTDHYHDQEQDRLQ